MKNLRDWLRGRDARPPEPWIDPMDEYVGPAVCVQHSRAVPCRVDDGTCIISEQAEDVLSVHEKQRRSGR